jgi:outer membrane protein assembly factor BamD (BamD/ComL family)
MKSFSVFILFFLVFGVLTTQTGVWDGFEEVAKNVQKYEAKANTLSMQNHELAVENSELKAQLLKLRAKNEHLVLSMKDKFKVKRKIASVTASDSNDLVQFEVYEWSANKLLDIAEQSFHFKKYEKAAQYFNALFINYPDSQLVKAETYFNAGIASFESKAHYDWAQNNFSKVVANYPASKYSRGSKLWLALAYHKTGKTGRFMASVDEFRLKYRNSKEWKVLSRYYEDIAFKFKK